MPQFLLDGRELEAEPGETVWRTAQRHGLTIPHLCLSTETDFEADGNCRACMVEVEGWNVLAASCILEVRDGMVVSSISERARSARRIVLELLRSDVSPMAQTEMAYWCEDLEITASRYPMTSHRPASDPSHLGMVVDLDACIHCRRCLQACREVECYDVIGMAGRNASSKIIFDMDDAMGASSCVSCGSCAQTCPTGAIRFRHPS